MVLASSIYWHTSPSCDLILSSFHTHQSKKGQSKIVITVFTELSYYRKLFLFILIRVEHWNVSREGLKHTHQKKEKKHKSRNK